MRPSVDTLFVWTGGSCVNGCAACPIDQASEAGGIEPAALERALSATPALRGRLVVLLGGEPLLRRDALRLIAAIRAAGCAPGIVTTGRPLLYPQVRDRLRRAGLAYLRIQLFGLGAAHDRATAVSGGFEQAIGGLRAWVGEEVGDCAVDVALSTRALSLAELPSDVERLSREIASPDVQIVLALDPGETDDAASLRDALAALSHWNEERSRPLLSWEGLPDSGSPAPHLTRGRQAPRFAGPVPHASCLGKTEALESAARAEGTKANSFNYLRSATTVPCTPDAASCTAHAAAAGIDPRRQIWLIENGQLVLHVTDTGDFGPSEIARVKDEWSHLFLDRAPAGVLDDIESGMRRVLPDPTCDGCPNRARCGRRFRVVDAPPFEREERWIAGHVAGLRGRVLDVGCGEQKYLDELAPLVRSGAVQYTGLDPDDESIARMRTELPQGRFHRTGIEEFDAAPASYDHVLCLRSLNHVADLDVALSRMAALLDRAGSLLIVETTPFAMLRRPEQVEAADRAPRAGHQHFRNVTSEEVLPFARRHALSVVEHQPAGARSTNEWILLLEAADRGGER